MAENGGGDFHEKLYTLQKRLKGERLFIRQDKDIIRSLNDSVNETCKKVYHLGWTTRQLWRNVERLITGARVFPSECTKTSILIDNVIFEDSSKHLGYQDVKYGEFLSGLRTNPRLVAFLLDCATGHGVDIKDITKLLFCCLYGGCILKEDENRVLKILQMLIEIQIATTDNVFDYFCSPKSSLNGFTVVLRLYSEMLFTSKLYLTAALHGSVMQVIVDDSVCLDIEISTVLSRLQPRMIREKFGDPGTPKSTRKMQDYLEFLQNCLVKLCNKFLKSLKDKIYCFPTSLRWILAQLGNVIRNKTNNDEKKTKALLGHVLMNYFICPAIINPEPFGINSDAFVSEIARYNLGQVASILRSMALAELGMKDPKVQSLLAAFEPGIITNFVDAVLHGADKLNPLNEKEAVEGLHPNAALMTEKELKSLVLKKQKYFSCMSDAFKPCLAILFMKKANSEDNFELKANGIEQLLECLPPLPRRWTKQINSLARNATSLPSAMQLNVNQELIKPVPYPRSNKNKAKKPVSMYSPSVDVKPACNPVAEEPEVQPSLTVREEYESILNDLQDLIEPDEKVLVISFGGDVDDIPGMLSEEKVLGIKDEVNQSTPVDSNDVEEERKKRASTMIQGAMKDLEGLQLHPSITEESSLNESATSSFFNETSSPCDGNIFTTPSKQNEEYNPIESTPVFSEKTARDSDLLIAFEEIRTQDTGEVLSPQRIDSSEPEQQLSLLDLSPAPANTKSFGFDGQKKDAFFENKSATLGPVKNNPFLESASKSASLGRNFEHVEGPSRTSYVSTGSLVSGLNKILQQPASFQSSFGLNKENPFEIVEVDEEQFQGSVEVAEDTILNVGEVGCSDSSGDSKDVDANEAKRKEGNESVFDDAEVIELNQSSQADLPIGKAFISYMGDTKSEAFKQMKKEMMEIEKRERKRTSGAWFKGKLATGKEKIKSVKKRSKSDGQALRKGGQQENVRKFTDSQPRLKMKDYNQAEGVLSPEPPLEPKQDVSEEILRKYRNISPKAAGLMEDDHSDDNTSVKETQFDEDFKFDDAKRKLRIVLCMADRSNFPCGASSCFQLFMTFLQAQLAEAINLQDRSVVAQLHETLRSIRQLPSDSCEKLLDALEEDYKRRAPYMSYLLRSKQGLLASLSHLEQIRKKVERDKAICTKYFTGVCVRLFLETPEKKREISQFSQKFEEIGMADEKCALLEEFLEKLYGEMKSNPTWVSASNEQWDDAKVATERTIMSKIYKAAFLPNGVQDIENDKIFHEHINGLANVITVNHRSLRIPKVLQKEAPWPSAQTELLMINAYKTPADKLHCIHRCCIAIMNLLSMATPSHTSGADEFVPVLVYVLIRANPPNLLSTKQYINNFMDNRLSGEEMYCWTQFCAATEFVKSLRS